MGVGFKDTMYVKVFNSSGLGATFIVLVIWTSIYNEALSKKALGYEFIKGS